MSYDRDRERELSPDERRLEIAKAERASFIVNLATSDRELMQGALKSLEESERGEGLALAEVRRKYGV